MWDSRPKPLRHEAREGLLSGAPAGENRYAASTGRWPIPGGSRPANIGGIKGGRARPALGAPGRAAAPILTRSARAPALPLHTGAMQTFRKHRHRAPDGFFAVEAAGLNWLASARAVKVASVISVDADSIVLERLPTASPTPSHARDFGRALAAMHDAGAAAFGSPPDGWAGDGFIGDAPLPLRPEPSWGAFYSRHRVLPYADGAHHRGALTLEQYRPLTALCARLERGDFDDPAPPARIHGDLWSGNVMWTPSGAALIDPAAHGGHRITDLAMLALFAVPYLNEILDAYARASDHLPTDWRALIPLHQVHPLLVHAMLFGGGYGAQAARAASAALTL
ncbi:MAG: fructosamine kinase family protein [Propioniciclava sp.]|uniref:fructosamine kinase family protein n=1 Tax=Propioniciclava sp. TaxID=2038686 RepID=UPI0039E4064F